MDELDLELNDVVLFELPTVDIAEAFRARFRARWPGWSHQDEQVWLFAAELSDEPDDLAVLLREAQHLLAEHGIPAICFVLDNCVYVLAPAHAEESPQAA